MCQFGILDIKEILGGGGIERETEDLDRKMYFHHPSRDRLLPWLMLTKSVSCGDPERIESESQEL